jgi:hypothetical protein
MDRKTFQVECIWILTSDPGDGTVYLCVVLKVTWE